MTRIEQFDELKNKMIKVCEDYITMLNNTSCDDLDKFTTRMPLLRHYIDSVHINTEFRTFVLDHYHGKRKCG